MLTTTEVEEGKHVRRQILDAIDMLQAALGECPMYNFDPKMDRYVVVGNLKTASSVCREVAKEVLPDGE